MAQLTDDCFAGGGPLMRADAALAQILDRLVTVTESEHVPPSVAADRLAEQRIDRVVAVRRSWLPGRR